MLELIQFLAGSKAFHSANSQMIIGIQESISPYSLNKISLSSTLWMWKLIQKQLEARDSRILVSIQFDYLKNPRMIYIVKEHLNLYAKLGMSIALESLSSINGSDEMLGYESLSLSRVRSIKDFATSRVKKNFRAIVFV